MRRRLLLAAAALVLLASCADLQAPEPPRRMAASASWDLPPSVLVLPLRLPPAPVQSWSETAVPASLKGSGSGQRTLTAWFLKHDWHYWWDYELKRTPSSAAYEGNRIRIGSGLVGDLNAHWDTLEGEISSEVEAETGIELALTLASDWKLETRAQTFLEVRRADVPIGIAWDGNFFGETISIAAPVRAALQPALESVGKDLEKKVAGLEVKVAAEAAWKDLQEPRAVAGTDLWLTLGPRALGVGALEVSAEAVSVPLVVSVHPVLSGPLRPEAGRRPLPPVTPQDAAQDRLVLNLPLSLRWTEAVKALAGRWQAVWDAGNGAQVKVRSLTPFSDGDQVLFKAEVTASPPWPGPEVDALVWLAARPSWDPQARAIRLTDLRYEPLTKAYLAANAPWVADGWLKALEKTLVWDRGTDLDGLQPKVAAALAALPLGPRWKLNVKVEGLEVVDFTMTEGGAEVLARVSGTASVSWVP